MQIIFQKIIFTRLIVFILIFFKTISSEAIINLDKIQIKKELKQIDIEKKLKNKEIIQILQSTLNWSSEKQESKKKIILYQESINNFHEIINKLKQKIFFENKKKFEIPNNLNIIEIEQNIIQLNSKLIKENKKIQQEQDKKQEIINSLINLPKQLLETKRLFYESTAKIKLLNIPLSILSKAEYNLIQTEIEARKLKINELEMAQLSAKNRQEISQLKLKLFKKRYKKIDHYLQNLRNYLNFQKQKKNLLTIKNIEFLASKNKKLPKFLMRELILNRNLSKLINKQTNRINKIEKKQRKFSSDIVRVQQSLYTIKEQSQWLNRSSILGETLKTHLYQLPEISKYQQIDDQIIDKRIDRLKYQDLLLETNQKESDYKNQKNKKIKSNQIQIYKSIIQTRKKLLHSLISGYDNEILELTKLKIIIIQLKDSLKDIKDTTHRYMFWIADTNSIKLNYGVNFLKDLKNFLSLNIIYQIVEAFKFMINKKETLFYFLFSIAIIIFNFSTKHHYNNFLFRVSTYVGKVNKDQFSITLKTFFWSIFFSSSFPILFSAIGYGLKSAWKYPISVSIGHALKETTLILWIFIVSFHFSLPKGLFIAHFGWPKRNVKKAIRYHKLSIFVVVPMIIFLIIFESYNNKQFSSNLGRFCFVLLCISLSLIKNNLKKVGVPLYLNHKGSGENIISNFLWLLLIIAPIFSALSALFGYFSTSQELLVRLETSSAIWFFLLIIYHIILRWMSIQRRKIAFERAKQKRAEIVAYRSKYEDSRKKKSIISNQKGLTDLEDNIINLDTISAQSIGLIRSILTMTALILFILIWSELYSAFSFLENIQLWNITTTIDDIDTVRTITLASLLIAILVIIITTQLIRNFPALLELVLLQHLDLKPGTGYAIITLTKYIIILIGSLISFTMIGIEWAKLQWLIAAVGVGLGFGLQEIFTNIISGLMILFEKPIRIGDTVTIRDLTGSISKINTRATTITDWDKKEIIVPNKAFITEQFINWSLSDTTTRIILIIPAPANINTSKISKILLNSAKKTKIVLEDPNPEVYLVNIEKGIQIFELRIYVAEIRHRMPARHKVHQKILNNFLANNIHLPFPSIQANIDILNKENLNKFKNKYY